LRSSPRFASLALRKSVGYLLQSLPEHPVLVFGVKLGIEGSNGVLAVFLFFERDCEFDFFFFLLI
jgi:hypothetical protein